MVGWQGSIPCQAPKLKLHQMTSKKTIQNLKGVKVVSVNTDPFTNRVDLLLSNGLTLQVWPDLFSKPSPVKVKKLSTPKILTDYLRSIGVKAFYIDRRANGFRIKSSFLKSGVKLNDIIKAIKSLECKKITEVFTQVPERRYSNNRLELIIRTTTNPSTIKI